ncbi:hypothetical protein [Catenovulum sediminis]|uniref:Uncharacterized protein n=1 Tax=Catenovulum sediminis TaxID=1740262 RepID=A0ABV1RHW3_9ALTE|nr:hypothetical protein [Catenovulum sediminis]
MVDSRIKAKIQGAGAFNSISSIVVLFFVSKSSVLQHSMESLLALFNLLYSLCLAFYFYHNVNSIKCKPFLFWLLSVHFISFALLSWVCLNISYALNPYLVVVECLVIVFCFGMVLYMLKSEHSRADINTAHTQGKGINKNVVVVSSYIGVFCSGWLLIAFGANGLIILLSFLFSLAAVCYLGVYFFEYFSN